MTKEYELCTELLNITEEILRNYNKDINSDIFKVKRQVMLRCPKTNELVPESQCVVCIHNFGNVSDKYIYCLPTADSRAHREEK